LFVAWPDNLFFSVLLIHYISYFIWKPFSFTFFLWARTMGLCMCKSFSVETGNVELWCQWSWGLRGELYARDLCWTMVRRVRRPRSLQYRNQVRSGLDKAIIVYSFASSHSLSAVGWRRQLVASRCWWHWQ
jgi:hypothetical protein